LRIMQALNEKRPMLTDELYERLIAIPGQEKTEDAEFYEYTRAEAESIVSEHFGEWEKWNSILPEGEKLAIPKS